jgi:hypothetical protein
MDYELNYRRKNLTTCQQDVFATGWYFVASLSTSCNNAVILSSCYKVVTHNFYTRKNLTSCSKSANKPSTSCLRTACPKLSTSLEQAVNNS